MATCVATSGSLYCSRDCVVKRSLSLVKEGESGPAASPSIWREALTGLVAGTANEAMNDE